ncbi:MULTISPECIES: GNAT family N-acetyltransferase [unclassified Beijerinckia]|uniref:GNAT family N-acetyltransferase n=1 Tax=unclassified Beijerinckia TaxID=2638183 RepID=UPI00089A1270|nr:MULTISPECIES: GNAT family N-acetyltransferase [unclassified Beijerinckia]MDH7795472.1 GNAT superfamily N-acetyltransferase [Beijerinckia sp. GAS462]SEC02977.1 Acetyltransferase (GNAT) family protein [Beijerinckia sp. 28-YEA-48]
MVGKLQWAALTVADLDEVGRLAAALHPGLPERQSVFAEKIGLFPDGCRKLIKHDRLVGYGIAHPWRLDDIPALDTFLDALPQTADCLYVHDVAIDPAARGQGAAGLLIADLRALAAKRTLGKLACVSVYGTHVMWARYGFRTRKVEALAGKLAGYGESAKYMVADV